MTNDELHETIGRIDANVSILVSRADKSEKRLGAVERHQWLSIGALMAAGALAFPKYRELFAAFSI